MAGATIVIAIGWYLRRRARYLALFQGFKGPAEHWLLGALYDILVAPKVGDGEPDVLRFWQTHLETFQDEVWRVQGLHVSRWEGG